MKTLIWSVAALILAAGLCPPARADDAAKKVVADAVKAHGGAENLAKHKDKSAIMKGKMHILAMGLDIDSTVEMFVGDKKFRQDISFSLMGMDFKQIVVYDGKQMWIALNGKVAMTIDKKEDLEALQEMMFAEEAAGLVLLGDKDVDVSIIGDDKVGDTPVVGVRVSKKGRKDVSLYFDKKTHLLKKILSRGLDFATKMEVEQERLLDDYKELDGQMRPMKATVSNDGKKVVDLEFTEIKHVDKLDGDTFDKPKE